MYLWQADTGKHFEKQWKKVNGGWQATAMPVLTQMPREWLNSCRIFILTKLSSRSLFPLFRSWFLTSSCTHAWTHTQEHTSVVVVFSRHILLKRMCGNRTIDIFIWWCECPKEVKIHFAPVHLRSPAPTFKMSIKMTTTEKHSHFWLIRNAISSDAETTKSVELNELNPIFWHFSYKKITLSVVVCADFGS